MGKDDMVTVSFRVKPEEQRLIERHAKKEGVTISSYVRGAVLFDMVMGGDWDAFKHVASGARAEVLRRMSERFDLRTGEMGTRGERA
jgi:hypothetical protein